MTEPNTKAKNQLARWAAAGGILVAYFTIFTSVSAHVTQPSASEYGPTLAAILSIALFRRILRLKSQSASEGTFKAGPLRHYASSYGRAIVPWMLAFIGLATAMSVFARSAALVGAFLGASIGIMLIGCMFAVDVPYRVYRRYLKSGLGKFEDGNFGWIAFLLVVLSLWIWRYAPAFTSRKSVPEKSFAAAGPRSAKEVFAAAEDSVVMLEAFGALGTRLNQGSGVILGRSTSTADAIGSQLVVGTDIVTNFHVVRNAHYVVIKTNRGTDHLASVLYLNEKQDFALLRGPFDTAGQDTRIASRTGIGERIFTISNPQGLGWSLSEGIVSRLPSPKRALVQFTAPVSPGSSGGGVYNERAELVGIITAVLQDSQNINFALYLAPIIKAIDELRRLPGWPFASLGSGDWKSGFFIADGKPVVDHDQYRMWSELSSGYLDAEKRIKDAFIQAVGKSADLEKRASSRMSAELVALYSEQEDTIGMWREQYPNDPDAALAYIEMLRSFDRTHEADGELIEALGNFPLHVDVTIAALESLIKSASPESAKQLLDGLEEQLRENEAADIRFSDDWSNAEFQRKREATDLNRLQYKDLLEIYREILSGEGRK